MTKEQINNNFTIDLYGGNKLYYALNNSKQIEICTNAIIQEITDDYNNIVELTAGNFTLKIGDNFNHKLDTLPSTYCIQEIEKFKHKQFKYCYYIRSHSTNKTTEYLVPCLGLTKQQLCYDTFLVNAYLMGTPTQITLLYRYSTTESYGRLEEILLKNINFVGIQNGVPGFDVVVMNIPEQYIADVIKFQNSRYSQISTELKQNIVKFHNLKPKDRLYQVIHKSKELVKQLEDKFGCSFKDIELDERLDLRKEIFSMQNE
jgi:hypothetical protein